MALQHVPTSLLTSSFSTKETPRADSNVALELAAAYHRDFRECVDDEQTQQVCRTYRDRILGVSRMAEVLAAAFKNAFPQSSQRPGRGSDGVAWAKFASLALRQHKTRDREAQKLQHQTCIVALWGDQVFKHYHWYELPLDYTRLLHDVARRLPAWDDAVDMINTVMLERHERRVVEHQNRSPLIGEHFRGSKIQDHRSPVQRQDINLILERLDKTSSPMQKQKSLQNRANKTARTPIQKYGLEKDGFGMIVPTSAPGVICQAESPSSYARKRLKLASPSSEDQSDTRNLSSSPTPRQPTSVSAAAMDSEMTDFEEGNCDGTSDEDTDRDSGSSDDNLLKCRVDGAEYATHGTGPDITSVRSQHSQESPSSRSCLSQSGSREVTRPDIFRQGRLNSEDVADATDSTTMQLGENLGTTGSAVASEGEAASVTTPFPLSGSMTDMTIGGGCAPRATEEVGQGSEALFKGPSDDAQRGHRQCGSTTDNQEEPSPAILAKCPPGVILTSEVGLTSDGRAETTPASAHSDDKILEQSENGLVKEVTAGEGNDVHEYPFEFETDSRGTEVDTGDELPQPEADPLQIATIDNPSPAFRALLQGTVDLNLHSLPTQLDRFVPAARQSFMSTLCTAMTADDDHSVVSRMASRYSSQLRDALEGARQGSKDGSTQEYDKCKVEWLGSTRWAKIHVASESQFNTDAHSEANADVVYMSWKIFEERARTGEIFCKPIVIHQDFQDSGMHEVQGYIAILNERFPHQMLDVQDGETGECRSVKVRDFCAAVSANGDEPIQSLATMSNAISLRKIANADAPLFTRLRRFRLLETLIERASEQAPGKRAVREANDVADCIEFDLLGFKGAFTRPHVDALMGTWVRCLSGVKAWIFVSDMNKQDWDDFAQTGPSWSPAGKGRAIILEKDDVLLMPPGLRVLHTVLTLEPSLMEGGMLWDERNIPALLDELLWVAQHQLCTNEALAYQLPSIIDALESWAREQNPRLSESLGLSDFMPLVEQGLQKLRALGCTCRRGCNSGEICKCKAQGRRCTAWCSKHPNLPDNAKNKAFRCMYEE